MTKITIDRSVVEQGLEALMNSRPVAIEEDAVKLVRAHQEAITALRAALAEPNRAQKLTEAGYTRRPTLREMAEPDESELSYFRQAMGDDA